MPEQQPGGSEEKTVLDTFEEKTEEPLEEENNNEKPPIKPEEKKYEFAPSSKPSRKSRKWAYVGILIIIIAGIASFWYFSGLSGKSPVTGAILSGSQAKIGDGVSVWYTGRLPDGKVFDTNVEEVAAQAGINKQVFQPLEFALGSGQVIRGFDEAVIGMKAGEKKTVTIPPEKAYGQPDPARIISSPRSTSFNRTETITLTSEVPIEQFTALFGQKKEGEEFKVPDTNLAYFILKVTNESAKVRLILQKGNTYRFPRFAWNTTVISLNGDTATVRHEPGETEIHTEFGNATLTYEEDKIIMKANPVVGMKIPSIFGPVTVVGVNEENVTVDLNPELAGKTLTFDIELISINKTQAPAPAKK